jgi:hypothetical protein
VQFEHHCGHRKYPMTKAGMDDKFGVVVAPFMVEGNIRNLY